MATTPVRIGRGIVTSFPGRAEAVTKSDSTVFADPSTIYCNEAGTVTVLPWWNVPGGVVAFEMVAGGTVPVAVKMVMSTGTDALTMVRCY